MINTKSMVQVALMATLIIVLGFMPAIPLGFMPVPIVLQNLGIMLAALLLGFKRGSLAIILFLVLGLFLPVFTGGATTLAVLSGPTAGYVLGWLLTPAALAGLRRLLPSDNFWLVLALLWLAGVLLVDVLGAVWLAHYTQAQLMPSLLSNTIFLPGDTIKAVVATIIGVRYRNYLSID